MSVISSGKKLDVSPWIKHFEEQATGGASLRSYINRHYIVVSGAGTQASGFQCMSGDVGHAVPPVLGVVEQGIEQAEEEAKREKVIDEKEKLVKDFEKDSGQSPCKKTRLTHTSVKPRRCRKHKIIAHDILS